MPSLARRASFLTLALLFAAAFFITYARAFHYETSLIDYSGSLYRAYRIYRHQMPYRDFYCPITPGTFFVQAAIWKLFGLSLTWTRLYLALCNGAIAALGYLFARRFRLSIFESALIAVVAFGWSPFSYMGIPWYDSDALTWSLVAGMTHFFLLGKDSPPWRFAFTGAIAAVVFLFKQNLGMACELLLLASIFVMPQERHRFAKALFQLGGALLLLLAFGLFLWSHHTLPPFFEWVYVRAKEGKIPTSWTWFLSGPLRMLFGPINHFLRIIFLIQAAAAGALAIAFFRSKEDAARRDVSCWIFFLVYGFGITYSGMVSNGGMGYPSHMIYLWVPFIVLRLFVRTPQWRWGLPLLVTLLMAQNVRVAYFLSRIEATTAVTTYALQSPRVRGVYFTDDEGKNFDSLVERLQPKIGAGESVWIYPEPVFAYFALDVLSPTPQTEYHRRPAMRREDQPAIIAALRGKNVRWATLWTLPEYHYSFALFPQLNDYLATHFEVAEKHSGYLLLHRPSDDFIASPASRDALHRLIRSLTPPGEPQLAG